MKGEYQDLSQIYGETLIEIGKQVPEMVIVDADLADSCKTEEFNKAFPDRHYDLGVAEQSLPTISAGLALCGKIPVYNTFAAFAVHRGLDMIRQSIAYNNANVKIVGHSAGQTMGYTGPSHHTLEDIAALRAIPRFCIFSPSDAVELRSIMWKMIETEGPVYLRLARASAPVIHDEKYQFTIAAVDLIHDGSDITLFSSGDLLHLVLEAGKQLESIGISTQVINIPCIKPLDAEELCEKVSHTQGGITVEDHNIYGGLGGLIAEIYAERLSKRLFRIGIPDTFTESDSSEKLREAYGISVEHIINRAKQLV